MIGNDWDEVLVKEYNKDYFKRLIKEIYRLKKGNISKYENLFKAFKYTPYHKVKIVILGQDRIIIESSSWFSIFCS